VVYFTEDQTLVCTSRGPFDGCWFYYYYLGLGRHYQVLGLMGIMIGRHTVRNASLMLLATLGGALVRWCVGALVRWCVGALLEFIYYEAK